MILHEHLPHLERLRPYYKSPMLLLGDQEFRTPFDFGCNFKTFDIAGNPDIKADLTKWIPFMSWNTVFNLGTLEHIWDVHSAYCNVAKMIAVGGYYIGHHPVAGYEGHGIHITSPNNIMSFFELNGFKILCAWTTLQDGNLCMMAKRNEGKSVILWFVAEKIKEVNLFDVPTDLC
jgi:hypothetical protein